jgi:hypothetical protein
MRMLKVAGYALVNYLVYGLMRNTISDEGDTSCFAFEE